MQMSRANKARRAKQRQEGRTGNRELRAAAATVGGPSSSPLAQTERKARRRRTRDDGGAPGAKELPSRRGWRRARRWTSSPRSETSAGRSPPGEEHNSVNGSPSGSARTVQQDPSGWRTRKSGREPDGARSGEPSRSRPVLTDTVRVTRARPRQAVLRLSTDGTASRWTGNKRKGPGVRDASRSRPGAFSRFPAVPSHWAR